MQNAKKEYKKVIKLNGKCEIYIYIYLSPYIYLFPTLFPIVSKLTGESQF